MGARASRAPAGRRGRGCVSLGLWLRRRGRERPGGCFLPFVECRLLSPGSGRPFPSGATGPEGKHDQRPRPPLRAAAPPADTSAVPLQPPLPACGGLTPPAGKPAPPLGRHPPGTKKVGTPPDSGAAAAWGVGGRELLRCICAQLRMLTVWAA